MSGPAARRARLRRHWNLTRPFTGTDWRHQKKRHWRTLVMKAGEIGHFRGVMFFVR